jgi:hypothetical protein
MLRTVGDGAATCSQCLVSLVQIVSLQTTNSNCQKLSLKCVYNSTGVGSRIQKRRIDSLELDVGRPPGLTNDRERQLYPESSGFAFGGIQEETFEPDFASYFPEATAYVTLFLSNTSQ